MRSWWHHQECGGEAETSLDGCETLLSVWTVSDAVEGLWGGREVKTPPPPASVASLSSSVAHDVVYVTWLSSETSGAAEWRRSGQDDTNLLYLLIGQSQRVGRFHWTVCSLELRLQTHSLRSAAPRIRFRFQTSLLQQVGALHANG